MKRDSNSVDHNTIDLEALATQVFVQVEKEHNLSPIPLLSRFLRACLYFHPNVTGTKYHSAYHRYLCLAFDILKAAHSVLQSLPGEHDPSTDDDDNSKSSADDEISESIPASTSAPPTVETETVRAWSDKSITD